MNSTTTQYITSQRMGVYEPIHQFSMWGDFKGSGYQEASATMIIEMDGKLDEQLEDTSHATLGQSNHYNHVARKPVDKVLRRLAQNREAARKSRLRKKAYVQQLETSRFKLIQLEQELELARQQNACIGGGLDVNLLGHNGTPDSGVAAFEIEYGLWVEEQDRQTNELRIALQSHLPDIELRILVDGVMSHYFNLFHMKATVAKSDVFYLMSGMWKTTAERFFMWIGGFRPSDLLKMIVPQLELLEQQLVDVRNLRQSCEQAEDAVSRGMDKLQQTLAHAVFGCQLGEDSCDSQMSNAMEQLEALVLFVKQADHLRQEALQQMSRILTTPQAAQGLIVLGEYFQQLRALSSAWANRHSEPV